MAYSDTRFAYETQRAAAYLIAPIMRWTGFRFSKASRQNRLLNAVVCRVSANLLADGVKPDRMVFAAHTSDACSNREVVYETVFVALALLATLPLSLGISYVLIFGL